MSRVLCIFLLLLSVAGCTTSAWVRDDVTPEQAEADEVDCQRRAWHEANARDFGRRGMRGPFATLDRESYRTIDEANLTTFCMQAKGYRRE